MSWEALVKKELIRIHHFVEFTPAEQECISDKISKLRDEGVEAKEATARAIGKCAPEKSTAKMQDSGSKQMSAIPGGNYRFRKEKDGTFTIFDVPIFAENERFEEEFNLDWLIEALKRAKAKAKFEHYLAPMHENHHRPDREVKRIGFVMPTRLGKIKYEGKTLTTMFANLLGINAENFARIKSGEFPYRSVEVDPKGEPEIKSLALLGHDVPFFQFPNMTLGEEITAEEPALAFHANKNNASILFKFEEQDEDKSVIVKSNNRIGDRIRALREKKGWTLEELAKRISNNTDKGAVTPGTMGSIERGDIFVPSAPMIAALAQVFDMKVKDLENLLAKTEIPIETERFSAIQKENDMTSTDFFKRLFQEEEDKDKEKKKKKDEEDKQMQDEDEDKEKKKKKDEEDGQMAEHTDDDKKMQDDVTSEVLNLIRQIAAKLGIGAREQAEEEEAEEAAPVQMSEKEKDKLQFAAVEQIAKRVKKMERKAATQELVIYCQEQLNGYAVDLNEITNYAKQGKESMEQFIKTVKQYGSPDTDGDNFEDFLSGSRAPQEKEEVMAYQSEGVEVVKKAREASRMFDELGHRANGTRKEFIANQLLDISELTQIAK